MSSNKPPPASKLVHTCCLVISFTKCPHIQYRFLLYNSLAWPRSLPGLYNGLCARCAQAAEKSTTPISFLEDLRFLRHINVDDHPESIKDLDRAFLHGLAAGRLAEIYVPSPAFANMSDIIEKHMNCGSAAMLILLERCPPIKRGPPKSAGQLKKADKLKRDKLKRYIRGFGQGRFLQRAALKNLQLRLGPDETVLMGSYDICQFDGTVCGGWGGQMDGKGMALDRVYPEIAEANSEEEFLNDMKRAL